ncbi:MAG: response regulator transcription factor [Chloroflexi bacterium]|nr:response regulator transcription factor [Chloroflexota bacterium]
MIRVLIVHETRLICDLKATVLRSEPDIEVIGCVAVADEALSMLKRHACDIVLVSVTLPNDGAFVLTRAVAKLNNTIKVLITGLTESKAVILRCIEEGVAGYVNTDESLTDLVRKIRCVSQGEFLVSPGIAAALISRISELKNLVTELNGFKDMNPNHLYAELTERECEVLDLIEQGASNQEIASSLCIELGTVKNHVHNILDKLDVRTRKHAAIIARQALANNTDKPEALRVPQRSAGMGFSPDMAAVYQNVVKPQIPVKRFATP